MYAMWIALLVVIFVAAMAVVVAYALHRLWCVRTWRAGRRERIGTSADPSPHALPLVADNGLGAPRVTVQLPMYNEPYVAERVIRAACAMDWPRDRLQIQVLDDSTDHTSSIIELCCRELEGEGYDIQHVRRTNRDGYKAGALRHGLRWATGEYVAIFDADFVPPADFLQRTISHFCDDRVGMAQACWSHLNEDLSLLTRTQAMLLDGHFLIEHAARHASGRWFNFNGTAGVWRRGTIESAGSWESDTLTEDVDLSYRAQMAGWRFVFLPDLQCAAELPCRLIDLRRQQWRWTAGSIAAARKLLRPIWRSEEARSRKVEATVHLLGPTIYVALLVLALALGPMLYLLSGAWAWLVVGLILAAALGSAATFYLAAAEARGRPTKAAVAHLPLLLMIAVGLSVSNTAAVLTALRGKAIGFVRTPKLHATDRHHREPPEAVADAHDSATASPPPPTDKEAATVAQLLRDKARTTFAWPTGLTELGLAGWCGTWALLCGVWWPGLWATLLLGLFAAGFAWVGAATLRDTLWRETPLDQASA